MKQNYDLSHIPRRRSLQKLFHEQSCQTKNRVDFVPFNRERDKLGHLISKKSQPELNNARFTGINHQSKSSKLINAGNLSSRTKKSDKTVSKIFKLNEIKSFKSSKQLPRLNLINPIFSENIELPPLNTNQFVQKISLRKYSSLKNDSIQTQLPVEKQSRMKPTWKDKKQVRPIISQTVQHNQIELLQQQKRQQQINYNLPELEKYFASKKLKVKLFDNFEQSHLRFKELAKHGTKLNQQIKEYLELY